MLRVLRGYQHVKQKLLQCNVIDAVAALHHGTDMIVHRNIFPDARGWREAVDAGEVRDPPSAGSYGCGGIVSSRTSIRERNCERLSR